MRRPIVPREVKIFFCKNKWAVLPRGSRRVYRYCDTLEGAERIGKRLAIRWYGTLEVHDKDNSLIYRRDYSIED